MFVPLRACRLVVPSAAFFIPSAAPHRRGERTLLWKLERMSAEVGLYQQQQQEEEEEDFEEAKDEGDDDIARK